MDKKDSVGVKERDFDPVERPPGGLVGRPRLHLNGRGHYILKWGGPWKDKRRQKKKKREVEKLGEPQAQDRSSTGGSLGDHGSKKAGRKKRYMKRQVCLSCWGGAWGKEEQSLELTDQKRKITRATEVTESETRTSSVKQGPPSFKPRKTTSEALTSVKSKGRLEDIHRFAGTKH